MTTPQNPFAGIITDELKDTFNDAIDALIASDGCSRVCRLVLEGSKFIECRNCYFNHQTGRSSGKYKPGGPLPFTFGTCGFCNGAGRLLQQNTKDITAIVIWNSQGFRDIAGGLNTTQSVQQMAQTFSSIDTWPDINRSNRIILDTNAQGTKTLEYEKDGDPELCGLGTSRYVLANWKRVT